MVTNPIPGNTYWTIRPVSESEHYEEFYGRKCKPWRGTLVEARQGYWHLCLPLPNGDADEDSNASAYVIGDDLYETREEALADYSPAQEAYIEWLSEKLQQAVNTLTDAKREIGQ
jgi:hypothetical protein